MASNDAVLGATIGEILKARNIETPMYPPINRPENPDRHIALDVRNILVQLGLDLTDDSLQETPKRVTKMYTQEVFYGLNYANFPACTTIDNKMGYDEVIASKKIDVLSMCEHHLVPFIGHAYVAYIPKTKVLGLSKFNRVVDFFARRPQVQERLTEQCHAAFTHILQTDDVAIVIECQHLCVRLRGVKQSHGSTVTSKLGGRFKSVDALRSEFFALTQTR